MLCVRSVLRVICVLGGCGVANGACILSVYGVFVRRVCGVHSVFYGL